MVRTGGASTEISDGIISTTDCRNYLENMPPSGEIGSKGWPCFRGGGAGVSATIEESGKALHGMVFYRPETVKDYDKLDHRQRRPRYEKAVEHCMIQEEAEEMINVSRFAVCVRENYPQLHRDVRKPDFALLRANVAFTNFKHDGFDRDAAIASFDGGVWINCTPDEPEEGSLVAPVSLCHATLFSIQEKACYNMLG